MQSKCSVLAKRKKKKYCLLTKVSHKSCALGRFLIQCCKSLNKIIETANQKKGNTLKSQ